MSEAAASLVALALVELVEPWVEALDPWAVVAVDPADAPWLLEEEQAVKDNARPPATLKVAIDLSNDDFM